MSAVSIHSISNKELSELIEKLQKNADQVERNIVDTEAKMQSVSAQLPYQDLLHTVTPSPGPPTATSLCGCYKEHRSWHLETEDQRPEVLGVAMGPPSPILLGG